MKTCNYSIHDEFVELEYKNNFTFGNLIAALLRRWLFNRSQNLKMMDWFLIMVDDIESFDI